MIVFGTQLNRIINNSKTGQMTIMNVTSNVPSNYYSAIDNTGVLTIIGGSITNNSTSSSAILNNGTLTLGVDDGELDTSGPVITSNNKRAIEQKGVYSQINFYDGTLIGKSYAMSAQINNYDTNYEIITTMNDTKEMMCLGITEDVAYVGEDVTNTFDTIQLAIEACAGTNDKITLLKPINLADGKDIVIDETQNITLDLAGYSIGGYSLGNQITNNGTFNLQDSSLNSTGIIRQYSSTGIKNNGTLIITGGQISTEAYYLHKIIDNSSLSTLNMVGGKLSCKNFEASNITGESFAIYSNTIANINVSGGIIEVYDTSNSKVTVQGICIDNPDINTTPMITLSGTVLITDIGGSCIGIRIKNGVKVKMEGGNITVTKLMIAVNVKKGEFEMTGGTISSTYNNNNNLITNEKDGRVIIKDNARITSDKGSAISNTGIIEMKGGKINTYYGITNSSNNTAQFIMTDGEIQTVADSIKLDPSSVAIIKKGKITSSNAIGININNARLVLGENDGHVINSNITITAKTYAISKYNEQGTFEYYEGRIHGDTSPRSGNYDIIPAYYSVLSEDNGKTEYIGILSTTETVAKVGSSYSNTFEDAITSIVNSGGTGTIEVQKSLITDKSIIIPASTNITLDLKGNTLRWIGTEQAGIINNGTLRIINSLEDDTTTIDGATIQCMDGTMIDNNGTLIIGNDSDGIVQINSPRIIGSTYAIDNTDANATMYFYDGILKGITATVNGTINNITSIAGYSLTSSTELLGEDTYITNILSN